MVQHDPYKSQRTVSLLLVVVIVLILPLLALL